MLQKYIEYVMIHFVYIRTQDKLLMMTRKRRKPSGTIIQVSDWYLRTLSKERSALRPDARVRYREWRIFSGNAELFTVHGIRFDQIYIFLGEEACHWIFFKKDPRHQRIEGNAVLPMNYCGCCIFNQHPRILEIIKGIIQK